MLCLLLSGLLLAPSQIRSDLDSLVHDVLWPDGQEAQARGERILDEDASLVGVDRATFLDLAEILRRGPRRSDETAERVDGRFPVQDIEVESADGSSIPVLVQLPSDYSVERAWPLLLAMHGGPTGDADGARRGAASMLRVWTQPAERAGWVVAAPAMLSTVAAGAYTPERLPYQIFEPEQADAVVDALRTRFRIDPDRIVPTGISLGSNFSIAYAAARPDRYAAIVPVSTEGDSRAALLRNLAAVPVYVLEGSRDGNIRGIDGPRALAGMLADFGADCVYREFSDRSHEGFAEHYDDVLAWLGGRPRRPDPLDVLRVPHDGIVPVARQVFWVQSDTRQGLIRARVVNRHRIELQARWARAVTLDLNDRRVDLDQPVEILVNGEDVFAGFVQRSIPTALRQARRFRDEGRLVAARLTLDVPAGESSVAAGRQLWESLQPTHAAGTLSYWEMYASRALVERWAGLGFRGEEERSTDSRPDSSPEASDDLPGEQVAIRVTEVEPSSPMARAGLRAGDRVLEIWGEPFFAGRGGVEQMSRLLRRELRATPVMVDVLAQRDGRRISLSVPLALGAYRSEPGAKSPAGAAPGARPAGR